MYFELGGGWVLDHALTCLLQDNEAEGCRGAPQEDEDEETQQGRNVITIE